MCQWYRGGQFYWGKLEYREEITDLPHVTDKLYHINLYQARFKIRTLLAMATECIHLDMTSRMYWIWVITKVLIYVVRYELDQIIMALCRIFEVKTTIINLVRVWYDGLSPSKVYATLGSHVVDITMRPNVQRLIERNVKCHVTSLD
jgi:hypothetical protein